MVIGRIVVALVVVWSGAALAQQADRGQASKIMGQVSRPDGYVDRDRYDRFWSLALGAKQGDGVARREVHDEIERMGVTKMRFNVEASQSLMASAAAGQVRRTPGYDRIVAEKLPHLEAGITLAEQHLAAVAAGQPLLRGEREVAFNRLEAESKLAEAQGGIGRLRRLIAAVWQPGEALQPLDDVFLAVEAAATPSRKVETVEWRGIGAVERVAYEFPAASGCRAVTVGYSALPTQTTLSLGDLVSAPNTAAAGNFFQASGRWRGLQSIELLAAEAGASGYQAIRYVVSSSHPGVWSIWAAQCSSAAAAVQTRQWVEERLRTR